MANAIGDVTRAVQAAVEAGRLEATDAERLLGRMLLVGAGVGDDDELRRQFLAVGVDAAVLQAAHEQDPEGGSGFCQARMLAEEGISSPRDLLAADPALRARLRRRWTEEVAGQTSGLSWDYLLLLSGLPGVKADRMVRRFVADALGRDAGAVSAAQAHALVTAAAERLGLGASEVDRAIWRFQSEQ